jgi:hypothetical protein
MHVLLTVVHCLHHIDALNTVYLSSQCHTSTDCQSSVFMCGSSHGVLLGCQVDPLDGTTLISQGRNGAVSVIAVAERGTLFDPGACMYMEKLAVPPEVGALHSPMSCVACVSCLC